MKNEPETLAGVIAENSMRKLAELVLVKAERRTINYERLTACLKHVVKEGVMTLIAEMKEADDAFYGSAAMLSTVLNVGCAKFACDAWVAYRNGGAQ